VQSLAAVSEKVKNFAILYCVDIDEVRRNGERHARIVIGTLQP
jgi:hypothetical protein